MINAIKGGKMKKTIISIIFLAIILITPKVYAAGNVSLYANKTSVNVGEEFTVSISLSRSTSCFTYSKNNSRYK